MPVEDPVAAGWYGRPGRQPAIDLSAQTAALEITPAPAGKPGGPGLWRVKGMELPPYFQNIRNALIRDGHTPADAYRITWGAIRRWAAGGGNVHPEVRAAAVRALAGLKAKAAIAHAHANDSHRVIELVGPKGYVHGWHYVGPQAAGARVFHPQFGHGTVTGHDGSHATVRFDKSGVARSFEAKAGKTGQAAKLAPRNSAPRPVPEWKRTMDEQAAKTKAAGEANAQGMTRRMALGSAQAIRMKEATGLTFPHPADLKAGAGNEAAFRASDLFYGGKLKAAAKALAEAQSAAENSRDKPAAARLAKLRTQIENAKMKPTLPPLARLGTNADGSIAALDHTGTEYKVTLKDGMVTVTSDAGTRTAPAGPDPTATARQLAAQLSGARDHRHASNGPAIDLAGTFTEALHPRVGGKFASKGGTPVARARARHAPKAPPVPHPATAPGQMSRAQQLRYQASQDRQLAHQIMVKVAALVRARDAAIAGIPAGKVRANVNPAKSAAAKKAALARKAHTAKATRKAARKASAKNSKATRVARLNGQIRLLTRDARLLMNAANHLDAQANGL